MGTYIATPGSSNISAYSGVNSWADIGNVSSQGFTTSNKVKDANELSGPFPILSTMNYGNGKVVFMGLVRSLSNNFLYRNNGWTIGLNAVNWLSNTPIPATYNKAGLIPYGVADMGYRILATIILGLIILAGLIYKVRHDLLTEESYTIKTIKKWKFYGFGSLNIIFIIIAVIMFVYLGITRLNSADSIRYDPYLGYSLLIVGLIYLILSGIVVYNIIFRQRMLKHFNYFNIGLMIFFAIYTILLGDLFSYVAMQLFTFISLILIIPSVINLLIFRKYGPDLIVEGKEFDRLKRLSVKSLPFELQPFFKDSLYIGEGGFGRVFKATRIEDGMVVAIKIPKSFDKRSEKTFISRYQTGVADHPNIVKLYELQDSYQYRTLKQSSVKERVEKGIKTLQEAVSIVYDVAKGLQYAHNKNIIHGDIKISNILIKNGINKISDWGLSKLKNWRFCYNIWCYTILRCSRTDINRIW